MIQNILQGGILTQELIKEDLRHIWHPCTQMKDHENLPIIPIKKGEGVWLYDFDGNRFLDGISSWWVNLFGHNHPYITSKLSAQAQELEHVLLAGFTHEGIIRLSSRLCSLLPRSLSKCFYADNGSSAIEVALKMSFHKARMQGKKCDTFLCLYNSYHGETLGALSVGSIGIYKDIYSPILLQTLKTPVPGKGDSEHKDLVHSLESALECLLDILRTKGERICAFILEPLVQCAGGMHMYEAEYVRAACNMVRSFGIDIIFDEIATGFGRTGRMFAFEECEATPDFLCLSKGITGGYLPLSVVVTTQEVYDTFYAPYEENKAFLHSHSYTGNALACSCANAVLDLFELGVIKQNQEKSSFISRYLHSLASSHVFNIRSRGMIFAFELKSEVSRSNIIFFKEALKRGILLRPLGQTIYFMPPYIIDEEEIDFVFEGIQDILGKWH